jgi:hypothetical protein
MLLHRLLSSFIISFIFSLSIIACKDRDADATQTATACVESDLVAQCPIGTSANLLSMSTGDCVDSTTISANSESGIIPSLSGSVEVSEICITTGACQVVCELAIPCEHGIKSLTKDEIICNDPPRIPACGDGICEAPESFSTCRIDCNGDFTCIPNKKRCDGRRIQTCNLDGMWEAPISCEALSICMPNQNTGASCVRP